MMNQFKTLKSKLKIPKSNLFKNLSKTIGKRTNGNLLPKFKRISSKKMLALFGGLSLSAAYLYQARCSEASKENTDEQVFRPGEIRDDLPFFTKTDVANHKTLETGIWVTYKEGVYDITEFIRNHPGGESKIKMAIGGPIDPFWKM